jgi:hypothetical protein
MRIAIVAPARRACPPGRTTAIIPAPIYAPLKPHCAGTLTP